MKIMKMLIRNFSVAVLFALSCEWGLARPLVTVENPTPNQVLNKQFEIKGNVTFNATQYPESPGVLFFIDDFRFDPRRPSAPDGPYSSEADTCFYKDGRHAAGIRAFAHYPEAGWPNGRTLITDVGVPVIFDNDPPSNSFDLDFPTRVSRLEEVPLKIIVRPYCIKGSSDPDAPHIATNAQLLRVYLNGRLIVARRGPFTSGDTICKINTMCLDNGILVAILDYPTGSERDVLRFIVESPGTPANCYFYNGDRRYGFYIPHGWGDGNGWVGSPRFLVPGTVPEEQEEGSDEPISFDIIPNKIPGLPEFEEPSIEPQPQPIIELQPMQPKEELRMATFAGDDVINIELTEERPIARFSYAVSDPDHGLPSINNALVVMLDGSIQSVADDAKLPLDKSIDAPAGLDSFLVSAAQAPTVFIAPDNSKKVFKLQSGKKWEEVSSQNGTVYLLEQAGAYGYGNIDISEESTEKNGSQETTIRLCEVAPNPARGQQEPILYLGVTGSATPHVQILDGSGRLIKEMRVTDSPSEIVDGGPGHRIPLGTDRPSGIYYLKVTYGEDEKITRFANVR